jgi:hypothetical protein
VLHGFVRASPSQDITPLLTRFETYLAGEESARLTVCRALAISDQEAFDAAFEARLRERRASIAADKERGRLEEPEIVTEQYVFVEALALLRIAELRGLSTQEEYPYCPSVARLSVIRP